jgi:methyl-accepting chemotaxis protein
MTIGRKIWGGFGLAALVLVIIGLISFWSTQRLITANDWVAHSQEVLTTLDTLVSAIKDVETSQRGYIITGSEASLGPYTAAVPELERASKYLKTLTSDNPEAQRRLDALEPLIATRLEELRRAVDARKAGGINAAAEVVKDNLAKKTMHEIRRLASELKASELKLMTRRNRDVLAAGQVATYGIAALVLLALVCGPLIVALIARPITRSLRVLSDGVEKFGQGQLDFRVNVRSRDEFGALAESFNRMAEQRQRSTEGINEAVSRLTSTSSQILATTSQQTASAAQQAGAVAETVATVEQVTHTATQSSERARGVGETVQRAREVGQTGRMKVHDSIAALDDLKERIESTAEGILTLAEQAQAIGKIISTVNDIAEQTNLLALNAAIEASRAGEQGRGFAVVAAEVRVLAEQSKKATAQVRQILGEIQKATNAAVLSTESVTKGVASAVLVANQSGDTINALADTLGESAQAAVQIVASMGQQAAGMTQINQAMKNLEQVAQQNLAANRQLEQAARDLNALGLRLARLIARGDGQQVGPGAGAGAS